MEVEYLKLINFLILLNEKVFFYREDSTRAILLEWRGIHLQDENFLNLILRIDGFLESLHEDEDRNSLGGIRLV